jgi:hypothetical protein
MLTNGGHNASRARVRTLDELHGLDDPVVAREAHFAVGMREDAQSRAGAADLRHHDADGGGGGRAPMDGAAGTRRLVARRGRSQHLRSRRALCVSLALYSAGCRNPAERTGRCPWAVTAADGTVSEDDRDLRRRGCSHVSAFDGTCPRRDSRAEPRSEVGAPPVPVPRDRRLKTFARRSSIARQTAGRSKNGARPRAPVREGSSVCSAPKPK